MVTLRQRVQAFKAQAEREFIAMLALGFGARAIDRQARLVDLLAELLLIPWREA